jgi:hypothetical protein
MDFKILKWIVIILPLILLYYFMGINGILIYIGILFLWFVTSPLLNTINDPNTSSSQKMMAGLVLIGLMIALFYLSRYINWNELFG